jgi:Spy/CpxP family protein refolding chaperone
MLSEKLSLPEDQKAKLKPILQDQAQQLRAVRDDPSLSPEQKSSKKKAIHELTHDPINSVLTPEQQDKFKQMKQASGSCRLFFRLLVMKFGRIHPTAIFCFWFSIT